MSLLLQVGVLTFARGSRCHEPLQRPFAETVADMEITTRQDALDCLDGLDEQTDDSCSSDDEDDGE